MRLLDTNILTALYAGHSLVIQRLQRLDDPQVATTIITKVELLQGRIAFLLKATNGESLLRAQSLLQETERLISEIQVIPFDPAASAQFDRLRTNKSLRKLGRADLLIASIALAHRATLVTRNLKDFRQVPTLKLEIGLTLKFLMDKIRVQKAIGWIQGNNIRAISIAI
jgi:tRNA(fMet)-specific endonuclease VapC